MVVMMIRERAQAPHYVLRTNNSNRLISSSHTDQSWPDFNMYLYREGEMAVMVDEAAGPSCLTSGFLAFTADCRTYDDFVLRLDVDGVAARVPFTNLTAPFALHESTRCKYHTGIYLAQAVCYESRLRLGLEWRGFADKDTWTAVNECVFSGNPCPVAVYHNWWLAGSLLPPLHHTATTGSRSTGEAGADVQLLYAADGTQGVVTSMSLTLSEWLDVEFVVAVDGEEPQIAVPAALFFGMGSSQEFPVVTPLTMAAYPIPFYRSIRVWIRCLLLVYAELLVTTAETTLRGWPPGLLRADYFSMATRPPEYFATIHRDDGIPDVAVGKDVRWFLLHRKVNASGVLARLTMHFSTDQKQVVENDFIIQLDQRVTMQTTGTEDFFNGGHGYNSLNCFVGPRFGWNLSGDLLGDDNGAWRDYRQFRDLTGDAIVFQDSFEVRWEYTTPDAMQLQSVLLYYS